MVEIPADHLVGPGGLCGTIQDDSCQELEFGGENLHDRRSTQRVRGTSPGSAVLTGESGRPSFQVNVSGSSGRKTELIFRFRKSFFIFQSFCSGLIITESSRTV